MGSPAAGPHLLLLQAEHRAAAAAAPLPLERRHLRRLDLQDLLLLFVLQLQLLGVRGVEDGVQDEEAGAGRGRGHVSPPATALHCVPGTLVPTPAPQPPTPAQGSKH